MMRGRVGWVLALVVGLGVAGVAGAQIRGAGLRPILASYDPAEAPVRAAPPEAPAPRRAALKAANPLPPRGGVPESSALAAPGRLTAGPGWAAVPVLVALAPDAPPGAWIAEPAPPLILPAWTGRVRPESRAEPAILVQVGAYARAANARRAAAAVERLGLDVAERGRALRIVAAGPFATRSEAALALRALRRAGFGDAYLAP